MTIEQWCRICDALSMAPEATPEDVEGKIKLLTDLLSAERSISFARARRLEYVQADIARLHADNEWLNDEIRATSQTH